MFNNQPYLVTTQQANKTPILQCIIFPQSKSIPSVYIVQDISVDMWSLCFDKVPQQQQQEQRFIVWKGSFLLLIVEICGRVFNHVLWGIIILKTVTHSLKGSTAIKLSIKQPSRRKKKNPIKTLLIKFPVRFFPLSIKAQTIVSRLKERVNHI